MAALPSDISRFTSDGIVVRIPTASATSDAIKAEHVNARGGDDEIEMFFDSATHAQAILAERFTYLSKVNPIHLGIEVAESLEIGNVIPIAPAVPTFRVYDEARNQDALVRLRAFAYDMQTDRYSVEVMS